MSDAKAEILGRVRRALADRPAPDAADRGYDGVGDRALSPDALLDLLEERLVDYKAVVHRAAPGEVAAVLAGALARHHVARVAVPDGFPGAWLETSGAESVGDSPPLSAAELDLLHGVVTTCKVAIATTGTIVLDGGAGQGRRALSLVPDLHIVVVNVRDVVRNVPDALPLLDPERPMTWISGPSATSDIELDRVEGVHGPRRLDVILELSG